MFPLSSAQATQFKETNELLPIAVVSGSLKSSVPKYHTIPGTASDVTLGTQWFNNCGNYLPTTSALRQIHEKTTFHPIGASVPDSSPVGDCHCQ